MDGFRLATSNQIAPGRRHHRSCRIMFIESTTDAFTDSNLIKNPDNSRLKTRQLQIGPNKERDFCSKLEQFCSNLDPTGSGSLRGRDPD